jgi:hypothetical protein
MLETKRLSLTDSEVRVWVIFAFTPPRGIILEKNAEGMKAIYLPAIDTSKKDDDHVASLFLSSPKSDWEGLWEFLLAEDIFKLPDAINVDADNPYPDATAIVIETKIGDQYRAVKYSGINTAEKPEAKKILKICQKISGELNIKLH